MSYTVVGLPQAVADEALRTGRSPGYGHPVHRETATGYGPCRVCLRPFREGEERRVLFTYDAFAGIESLPLPGPVFVHEEPCAAARTDRIPDEIRFIPFTLNAYGTGRNLREVVRHDPDDGDLDAEIGRLLARPDVDYIHVRNTEAGCYVCRVER